MLRIENLEVFSGTELLTSEVVNNGISLSPHEAKEILLKLSTPRDITMIGFFLTYTREINWDIDTTNNRPVDYDRGDLWAGETYDVTINHYPDKKKIYVGLERKTTEQGALIGEATMLHLFAKLTPDANVVKVWIEVRNL
jgi:hypothetical protein